MQFNMIQYTYINKKWSMLAADGDDFYLSSDEKQQCRSIYHKKYITKAIFLSDIAYTRIVSLTDKIWDSKLSIQVFPSSVPQLAASRINQRNQWSGTKC